MKIVAILSSCLIIVALGTLGALMNWAGGDEAELDYPD